MSKKPDFLIFCVNIFNFTGWAAFEERNQRMKTERTLKRRLVLGFIGFLLSLVDFSNMSKFLLQPLLMVRKGETRKGKSQSKYSISVLLSPFAAEILNPKE